MLLDLKYRRRPGVTQRDIQIDNYNFFIDNCSKQYSAFGANSTFQSHEM
jgi:hypothetical protein